MILKAVMIWKDNIQKEIEEEARKDEEIREKTRFDWGGIWDDVKIALIMNTYDMPYKEAEKRWGQAVRKYRKA